MRPPLLLKHNQNPAKCSITSIAAKPSKKVNPSKLASLRVLDTIKTPNNTKASNGNLNQRMCSNWLKTQKYFLLKSNKEAATARSKGKSFTTQLFVMFR